MTLETLFVIFVPRNILRAFLIHSQYYYYYLVFIEPSNECPLEPAALNVVACACALDFVREGDKMLSIRSSSLHVQTIAKLPIRFVSVHEQQSTQARTFSQHYTLYTLLPNGCLAAARFALDWQSKYDFNSSHSCVSEDKRSSCCAHDRPLHMFHFVSMCSASPQRVNRAHRQTNGSRYLDS